jgi:DNA polymerase-1
MLVLIDVSNLIYRAFYTLPVDKFKSSDGTILNAVYGVCTMIMKIAADFKDAHLVCCFDSATCNAERKKIDPQYKANRAKAPSELGPQFKLVRELIKSMELEMLDIENMEADDIIASLVETYYKTNEIIICSPDKDYSQLLQYSNVVQYDPKKKKYINADDIIDKYKVDPSRFTLYQALLGDKCDNVPGCPGIGPKIAAELVNLSNGTLNHLLTLNHKKIELVKKNLDSVERSLALVTLTKRDITIDFRETNIINELFRQFCEKCEFSSIVKKYYK